MLDPQRNAASCAAGGVLLRDTYDPANLPESRPDSNRTRCGERCERAGIKRRFRFLRTNQRQFVCALAALPVLSGCASAPAYADAFAAVALIVLAVGLYVAAETR